MIVVKRMPLTYGLGAIYDHFSRSFYITIIWFTIKVILPYRPPAVEKR